MFNRLPRGALRLAFYWKGYRFTPGLLPGEFVRVGRFVTDGDRHFSAETNANYNEFVIRAEDFSGTYTYPSNCTVNIQYAYENVLYIWSGDLVDNGKGADFVVSNPRFAVTGDLQQQ